MKRRDLFALPLERAEELARYGAVSKKELRLLRLAWSWATWRLSGEAGRAQDRFRERRGIEALERRRARVRATVARLIAAEEDR